MQPGASLSPTATPPPPRLTIQSQLLAGIQRSMKSDAFGILLTNLYRIHLSSSPPTQTKPHGQIISVGRRDCLHFATAQCKGDHTPNVRHISEGLLTTAKLYSPKWSHSSADFRRGGDGSGKMRLTKASEMLDLKCKLALIQFWGVNAFSLYHKRRARRRSKYEGISAIQSAIHLQFSIARFQRFHSVPTTTTDATSILQNSRRGGNLSPAGGPAHSITNKTKRIFNMQNTCIKSKSFVFA